MGTTIILLNSSLTIGHPRLLDEDKKVFWGDYWDGNSFWNTEFYIILLPKIIYLFCCLEFLKLSYFPVYIMSFIRVELMAAISSYCYYIYVSK